LARQHYESWSKLFAGTGLTVSLKIGGSSTGTVTGPAHRSDVVIGTTALFSDSGILRNSHGKIGLLIVDEEHKFGKDQKEFLNGTNRLLMTATPIPAALTATLFADLDVTTIREMPEGRGWRHTKVLLPNDCIVNECEQFSPHVQTYRVFPRIEGPGGLNEACKGLSHKARHARSVAVVHGQQPAQLNAEEIEKFVSGELTHMWCTSMLEVGIDNPNANVIIIHDANMFGLSQLHQMRGRVGRGENDSHCFLLLNTDDQEAHDRVRFLETCDDGFEVAEKDLELRGPGELAGNRQSGITEFKLTDLVSDYNLIKRVRKDMGI
jgi:ATP-dependent DNA helicase RecG